MSRLEQTRNDLAFSVDEVAGAAGWSVSRQLEIERGDEPTDEEADVLTRLYGVDVEALVGGEDGDATRQPLRALLRGPSGPLSLDQRFEIAEVATIAREHRCLLAALGRRDRWPVVTDFRDDGDYTHPSQGSPDRLAAQVRQRLALDEGPIPSVSEVARRDLGILVVWVDVEREVDAFALAGPDTGPVIALNASGAHTANAFSRRVTLAHEICHVLFDRRRMADMTRFCRIAVRWNRRRRASTEALPIDEQIERRARAFAACLLVPRKAGVASWGRTRGSTTSRRVRSWMAEWGIGYEAARGHLDSLGRLGVRERLSRVETTPPPVWELAEPGPPRTGPAATVGVPLNRRGDFFGTVIDGVREQAITPGRARELLLLSLADWQRLVDLLPAPPVAGRTRDTSGAVLSDWL